MVVKLRASELATSGSVIKNALRISPLSKGSRYRVCWDTDPNFSNTSMLPVSGAEQLHASDARGEDPMISAKGAYSRLVSIPC